MNNTMQRATRPGLDFSTKQSKPLIKYHSIPIKVRRYFTDVDGAIVAKAAVPIALKTEYPFYVFGDFDRSGGYNTGLKALPPQPGTFYLMSFVSGNGLTAQQITGFTGFNTVREKIQVGDIVHVFTDSLNAPNYFIWIVLTNANGSIASITGNSESSQRDGVIGKIYVNNFQYFTDNAFEQWGKAIHFTRSSNITSFRDEQVQPNMFRNPHTEQDGFILVECNFNLDQYQSIGIPFLYNTELIQVNFNLAITDQTI